MINNSNLDKAAEKRRLLLSFFMPLGTALFILLPFLVMDKGFFLYCGDFNSQQIPFYSYISEYFKTGGGSFSWETDLGSGIMNTYSFYHLGSPFMWLSLLFPTSFVPYLMAPLLMLKFAVGGLGAYLFMRRYVKDRNWAVVGAVLYCFSGWGVYNIFFNHFIDCMALFPFLLWALDEFMYDNRKGVFPLFVAINLINNYFFFLGEIVFLLIYFFIKLMAGDYKITLRKFGNLLFESVLGCMIGCLLVFPAAASLMNNPRTGNMLDGYSFLHYSKPQQYLAILVSMFIPPEPPYMPNLFEDANVKWTSLSLYLPLMGCAGVISFIKTHRKSALRNILFVSLIMALVPGFNSAFYALNSSYYARWFFMPILIMAMCSVMALEKTEIDLNGGIKFSFGVLLFVGLFGIIPTEDDHKWKLGAVDEIGQLALTLSTAVLGLVILTMIIKNYRGKPVFVRMMLAACMAFSVMFGISHLAVARFPQMDNDQYYKQLNYDNKDKLDLPEDDFYRIDTFSAYDNIGMHMSIPCIRAFNSTVTPSILEFYPSVGVKRDVSSKPALDHYALRGLLSVDYLLVPTVKKAKMETELTRLEDLEIETGFSYERESGDYMLYKNDHPVPMGFTYDYFISEYEFEQLEEEDRANALMRCMVVSDTQAARYSTMERVESADIKATLDFENYKKDCADRAASACSEFEATREGFEASITLEENNLVFFSVPYDEGFNVTVNGKEVEVLDVSNGLIAIPGQAGDNEIELTLTPKWLPFSASLTAIGFAIYGAYAFILYKKRGTDETVKTLPLEMREDYNEAITREIQAKNMMDAQASKYLPENNRISKKINKSKITKGSLELDGIDAFIENIIENKEDKTENEPEKESE